MSKKKFTSTPKSEIIEVDGVDYVITQMTGEQAEEYRESMRKRYDANPTDPDKVVLARNKGMYQDLFDRCLFLVQAGSQRGPVPKTLAQQWSDECCEAVFFEIQKLNAANKEGQDEAKKD